MTDQDTGIDMLALTAQIVAAHVSNTTVAADALPGLIGEVFRALSQVGEPAAAAPAVPDRPQPAVPVKRSVYPDYIVCLEDGKRLKMLKRHLMTSYGHDARRLSPALGAAVGLPDGGAELRQPAFGPGPADRARPQAGRHGLRSAAGFRRPAPARTRVRSATEGGCPIGQSGPGSATPRAWLRPVKRWNRA